MLTKATITKVPNEGENEYEVSVPYYQGNDDSFIIKAILCTFPGYQQGYEVGDVVIVDFLERTQSEAVIFGKLFTPNVGLPKSSINTDNLVVTGNVNLPVATKIGNVSAEKIFNLEQELGTLVELQVVDYETEVEII